MKKFKKLVIAPHIDDDILGCGGIIDADTFVLYCGMDESHIVQDWVRQRPSSKTRLDEVSAAQDILGYQYDILHNKVNHYIPQDLISSFEKFINELKPEQIYIPHNSSYNQDHRSVHEAAIIALRPHDMNWFVKKVFTYEQPHVFFWSHFNETFKPSYFIEIDINKKIQAYNAMESQVRKFRSKEQIKSMANLRGAQSNCEFAESFEILRWVD